MVLLQDPADPFAPQIYKFSPYAAVQFDRSQVILRSNKMLRRGQRLAGYILGTDPDPIPAEFRNGARVTAILTVYDQFGQGHRSDLVLTVDRSAEFGPKPRAPKPRAPLFAKPDKIVGNLPGDSESLVQQECLGVRK